LQQKSLPIFLFNIFMKNTDQVSALRWKKIPVLDNGFVCLVDVMGDDSAIVQAARVSYGDGTKKVSDDRTLLRYLLRHQHTTPFEMAELKLLVRVPMDCWRQWIRHRTASVNEYSTRYSIAIDAIYATNPADWRMQSETNKQGSYGNFTEEIGKEFTNEEHEFHTQARNLYEKRIARGVAREQARKDLPLSTYTEAYWKIDLHNLFRFLALRMDSSAQFEIVQYANAIGKQIVQPLFPYCWEAFLDYQLGSIRLSRLDQGVITRLAQNGNIPATREQFLDAQDPAWQNLEHCREREECYKKLQKTGIIKM
jgi:thymidylate synthase (FAD)